MFGLGLREQAATAMECRGSRILRFWGSRVLFEAWDSEGCRVVDLVRWFDGVDELW